MQGVLFLIALLVYAGTYTLSAHFARGLLDAHPTAFAPRLIGLAAVALATAAFVYWAQVTFVDPALYSAPDPLEHGRFRERILAISVAPALVVAVAALVLGWRASQRYRVQAERIRGGAGS
jgi:hypothetical protein